MSGFDYALFFGCGSVFLAFNARKYAPEEAYPIAAHEFGAENLDVKQMWCYYGFGVDEDGDRRRSYWLTEDRKANSFPVLVYTVID